MLATALVAVAAFILGLRAGIALGYRGARRRMLEQRERRRLE